MSHWVPKLVLLPLLLLAACLVAGLYGALHNQISYSVAPDYFHAFKFQQFRIAHALENRLGASLVGWLASWWMGLVIGLPILLVGLLLPDSRTYLNHTLIAFGLVAVTALVVGLAALVVATCSITETTLPDFWYPEGITDKVAFARAGTMHNFSYLGGFLGLLVGVLYVLITFGQLRGD